jgi:ATP-dependent DNA ligase
LKLVAFDVPQVGLTIEAAQEQLAALRLPDHASVVQFSRVESNRAAFAMRDDVVRARGEGIMLRQPRTTYTGARVNFLLKLKP